LRARQQGNGSEQHSLRVMGANGGSSPTTISNNEFTAFGGVYRALWVMSRPHVTIENNTFTPLANQSDFTAILVGNREVWNGLPAPQPYDVVIRANTFSANGAPANNKGKAIEFVDDNDANGAAGFTRAIVGGNESADANLFDAAIGWYIALDDRSCTAQNHDGNSGGCNGGSGYAIGFGIAYSGGSNQSSQKRPFVWDINAVGNRFGGVYMPTMTQVQFDAVWAKTYDRHNAVTAASVGNVLYGYPPMTSGTIVFSPTGFTFDGNAHTIVATLAEDAQATCVVTPASVTDAGDTPVNAICTSATYNVSGSGSVHVDKATGAVTWGQLSFEYDGTLPTVTATLTQDGSACTVTGSVGPDVGDYAVHADCSDNNYTASADETAHVTPAHATLTIDSNSLAQTYDGNPKAVTVIVAPSGVAYGVTYDGNAAAPTAAGSYLVNVQITDANYQGNAVLGTLVIAKASQTINNFVASPANPTYSNGGTFNVAATGGGSGNPVVFDSTTPSVCTISATTVTMLAAGHCALTADQAGNGNYAAAAQVTLDVTINEPPLPDVGIGIDSGRDHVQYGKQLTYTIIVSNLGNTNIDSASVTDNLPPELDASTSSWTCYPAGGTTCNANGSGTNSLSGSVQNLPVGADVAFVLTVTVRNDAGVPTEQVVNMVSVSTAGDTNPVNDSATATTQIVIFRDGFEPGGDGAQNRNMQQP
jgi:uncharacterized repeat protein (TIGR01451 family)